MIVACTWGEYVCTWFMWGSLLTCMYVGASHESHKSHVTSQPNTIWTKSRVQVEFGVGWCFLDPNNISCALSRSRTAYFFIPNNVWTKYSFGWYLKLRKRSQTGFKAWHLLEASLIYSRHHLVQWETFYKYRGSKRKVDLRRKKCWGTSAVGPGCLVRLYYKKGREYDWIIEVLGILRSLPVLWVPWLRLVTWGSHQRMERGVLLVGRRLLKPSCDPAPGDLVGPG